MKRIKRSTVTEQVFDQLLNLLKTQYRPGDQLPTEQELMAQFGVSRTPIREALSALSLLNIVESTAGKGTFVRNIEINIGFDPDLRRRLMSGKTLRELIEVRRMIEVEAAGLAAQRATPAHLEQLEHDVNRLAESIALHQRVPEDLDFHLTILKATDNKALVKLGKIVEEFYAVDGQPPTGDDARDHRAIYEAIKSGDPIAARKAMEEHLKFVEAHLFRLANEEGING